MMKTVMFSMKTIVAHLIAISRGWRGEAIEAAIAFA